jgi:hypothetical protein
VADVAMTSGLWLRVSQSPSPGFLTLGLPRMLDHVFNHAEVKRTDTSCWRMVHGIIVLGVEIGQEQRQWPDDARQGWPLFLGRV